MANKTPAKKQNKKPIIKDTKSLETARVEFFSKFSKYKDKWTIAKGDKKEAQIFWASQLEQFINMVEPMIDDNWQKKEGSGQPPRYTPRELFNVLVEYLASCIEYNQPPTILGAFEFNGMNRMTIYDKKNSPGYEFLELFRAYINHYTASASMTKQNPAGPIFMLKNTAGMTDKIEVDSKNIDGAMDDDQREDTQARLNGVGYKSLIEDK